MEIGLGATNILKKMYETHPTPWSLSNCLTPGAAEELMNLMLVKIDHQIGCYVLTEAGLKYCRDHFGTNPELSTTDFDRFLEQKRNELKAKIAERSGPRQDETVSPAKHAILVLSKLTLEDLVEFHELTGADIGQVSESVLFGLRNMRNQRGQE